MRTGENLIIKSNELIIAYNNLASEMETSSLSGDELNKRIACLIVESQTLSQELQGKDLAKYLLISEIESDLREIGTRRLIEELRSRSQEG